MGEIENWFDLLPDEVNAEEVIAVSINGVLYNSFDLAIDELKKPFTGMFNDHGEPFTLWTKDRVYFPVVHDNDEWIDSAPRFPTNESVKHVGRS